jgi:hypothetical protein
LHEREVVVARVLLERALSHRPRPQRGVPDVGGEVDALGQAVDGVEVLRERLERPIDAFRERGRVDVLRSLEVAHDERALGGPHGREREAAVAHDGGRDAVPARVAARCVPEHLRVHVRVTVDEPRGDDVALRVDLGRAALADAADERNAVTDHADIGPERP